ncbi:peptidoglycan-binding domain-containing protein [Actinoplanes palleronii]|uniref:Peptidoglycan-binding protein n=1 Tax=Actinoplanes palleronii TaxID=113570 RepID=A0ABQ4BP35_9ACTN|nr:peptidoglycan-binding domain-containing protein [Actinoplanes palleronii]GIE72424.1 peptidoglycan-binding protein [Actinoplanes palleronii]
MKARTTLGTAVAATLVAGSAAGILFVTGRAHDDPDGAVTPAPTATVTRTDLVQTEQVDGVLGYAGTTTVSSATTAIVTWLPQPGDTITRGQHVYDAANQPVPLFYGRLPFWRELHRGVPDGPDVRILEQNLDKLGYGDGLTVDDDFTDATAAAVRKWQKARHVPRTGRVATGDVVVLPGAIRVAEVKARLGAPASGDVLTATGTRKQVAVDLPATKSGLAVKGAKVTVGLPDGSTARGRITVVGTTAQAPDKDSPDDPPTLPVTVALDDPATTGALDGAPVTVGLRGAVHKKVLAVPVGALLALAEGGFGVQVVADGGAQRIVGVTLGAFANGQVEIKGEGLSDGTKVTVPAA